MNRLLFAALLAAGCSGPADSLPPPPDGQGFQLAMDMDTPPGTEALKCQIGKLDVQGVQDIHHVEHLQSSGIHHMNVTVLINSGAEHLPPGVYDCNDLYAQYPKLMEQTIIYAAQAPTADITLPPGIAAVVPGGITIMIQLHHINATSQPQHVFTRVNAWNLPPDQPMTGSVGGFVLRDHHLNIPPHSEVTEWAQCVMDQDVDLLFLTSHMHHLGKDAHILKYGGADSGTELYVSTDWQSPRLYQFDPPMHLSPNEGIEVRCHFVNDGDNTVTFGESANDEMCFGILVFTPGLGATCKEVANSAGMPDDTNNNTM
jgi:hypothetical protein